MIRWVAVVIASVVMIACSVADNDTVGSIQVDSPSVALVTSSWIVTTVATQQAVSEPVRRVQSNPGTHIVAAAMSTPNSVLTSTTRRSVNSSPSMMTSAVILSSVYDDLLHHGYSMYERSDDVLALQHHLGLKNVDGIYGPITRAAHMDFLGGPLQAVYIFFPEFGQMPTPCREECFEPPTLGELVDEYFQPDDRAWALRVAFCESSGQPHHTGSAEVSSALAIGWFQHLAKYWIERSESAGWPGASPFDPEANVAVAAWLFYEDGGARHWNPSRTCWEEE